MKNLKGISKKVAICLALSSLMACASASKVLNPFYEEPSPVALMGSPNDHALSGGHQREDTARKALEHMANYQRAHAPEPVNPVVQPAVVRLMWVPDRLNSFGDLVPAHYYYLRVLRDRWAVTDAFELEQQIQGGSRAAGIPFVNEGTRFER